MAKVKFNPRKYELLSLSDLANELHVDYYQVLRGLVQVARQKLTQLTHLDIHHTTRAYTNVCARALNKVELYISIYEQELLPYAVELHGKDVDGHDCGVCSGKCSIGHQTHLAHLREIHIQLRKQLDELYLVALPLHSCHIYPGIYKSLREEMMLIEIIVRELLYLQEANLVPLLMESQKKINVHSHQSGN